jgi:CRP/FNR family transcriptional regulator
MTWIQTFPELESINDPAWLDTANKAKCMQVKKGAVLFRDGEPCNAYVLVLSGSVRVQKMDAQGHEMILYRVEEGQSCILTTTCMLGNKRYPAEGIAETDVDLALLSLKDFNHALAKSDGFRQFVMANISGRICDLMLLLEDVAFGRMDTRLAKLLLKNISTSHTLNYTHKDVAVELGTAREVVSRLLKDFERKGLVQLGRNQIRILDIKQLQTLAAADK